MTAPQSERWPIFSRRTWQDPCGKWTGGRHAALFLRGRTGANSVLNKDKISVQFPSTLNIIATYFYTLHWGATFPSSPSLLSSPIVFYKSDIINQTLAIPLFIKGQKVKGQRPNTKVAGQILVIWWSESEKTILCKPFLVIKYRTYF